MGEKQKRVLYGILGIFIFLCIWYVATKFTSLGQVMPDPVTVFSGFFIAFVEPIGTHSMIVHILISLRRKRATVRQWVEISSTRTSPIFSPYVRYVP